MPHAPMIRANRSIHRKSGLGDRLADFVNVITGSIEFDAVETGFLRDREFLLEAGPVTDHADLESLVKATL